MSKKPDRPVVIQDAMGSVLDSNVSLSNYRMGRKGKILVLPCGFQLAFEPAGRLVGCRAPQEFGLSSCARLTIDEIQTAMLELQRKLEDLEGRMLEAVRESTDTPDEPEHADLVCGEVPDEALPD